MDLVPVSSSSYCGKVEESVDHTYTHTHTHARTHARTHTHTHTLSLSLYRHLVGLLWSVIRLKTVQWIRLKAREELRVWAGPGNRRCHLSATWRMWCHHHSVTVWLGAQWTGSSHLIQIIFRSYSDHIQLFSQRWLNIYSCCFKPMNPVSIRHQLFFLHLCF